MYNLANIDSSSKLEPSYNKMAYVIGINYLCKFTLIRGYNLQQFTTKDAEGFTDPSTIVIKFVSH